MKSRATYSTAMVTAISTTAKITELMAPRTGLRCVTVASPVRPAPWALRGTPTANSVGRPAPTSSPKMRIFHTAWELIHALKMAVFRGRWPGGDDEGGGGVVAGGGHSQRR